MRKAMSAAMQRMKKTKSASSSGFRGAKSASSSGFRGAKKLEEQEVSEATELMDPDDIPKRMEKYKMKGTLQGMASGAHVSTKGMHPKDTEMVMKMGDSADDKGIYSSGARKALKKRLARRKLKAKIKASMK